MSWKLRAFRGRGWQIRTLSNERGSEIGRKLQTSFMDALVPSTRVSGSCTKSDLCHSCILSPATSKLEICSNFPSEEITGKVMDVLQDLGEKSKRGSKSGRVKMYWEIISTRKGWRFSFCRNLRISKTVTSSSPCSLVQTGPQQRTDHRELVKKLRSKREEDKEKRFYIKGRQIRSADHFRV